MKKIKDPPAYLEELRKDYYRLRNANVGQGRILDTLKEIERDKDYLASWYKLSRENDQVYPSQGLLKTPFDYLNYGSQQMLPQEMLIGTLRLRWFFLEMFNHPYRVHFLEETNRAKFAPVPKVTCKALESTLTSGLSLSIGDIGASVVGADKERLSRTLRYAQGPFVKLGKQARSFFVGSASPDVWNSAPAIATMAASHCLSGVPRNGLMSNIKRQTDLAKEVFDWLTELEEKLLMDRDDRRQVAKHWRNNVMGTLESVPAEAVKRAKSLYQVGVRVFRIYSPEPGIGPIETVKALRHKFKNEIEIFTGQIVAIDQAKKAEAAGADGIFVGVGGGGRCITGMRSGSVVDWPELVWKLRGEIKIPVIVEGGASDHVAVTLLLGASGISVSRVVSGGTIESPGGALFYADENGRLFKPYGGEASARTKYLDNRLLPFNIPAFVEGETAKAQMSYVKHVLPTLTYNLHLLIEDAILAMVFRNVQNIHELHAIDPSPLRQNTSFGEFQRNAH